MLVASRVHEKAMAPRCIAWLMCIACPWLQLPLQNKLCNLKPWTLNPLQLQNKLCNSYASWATQAFAAEP
jgi:hypothetical protein